LTAAGQAPVVITASGIGMIIGSLNSWSSVTLAGIATASASGTEHGGPGWISLISGVLLVITGLALVFSRGVTPRLLCAIATAASGASFGIAMYFLLHILLAGTSDIGIGWGLVVVFLASITALVATNYNSLAAGG
jgi:hypothetical protein